jgi:hypothetical protein
VGGPTWPKCVRKSSSPAWYGRLPTNNRTDGTADGNTCGGDGAAKMNGQGHELSKSRGALQDRAARRCRMASSRWCSISL